MSTAAVSTAFTPAIAELKEALLNADFVRSEALKMLRIQLERAINEQLLELAAGLRNGSQRAEPGALLKFRRLGDSLLLTGLTAEVSDDQLKGRGFGSVSQMAAHVVNDKRLQIEVAKNVLEPIRLDLEAEGLADVSLECWSYDSSRSFGGQSERAQFVLAFSAGSLASPNNS